MPRLQGILVGLVLGSVVTFTLPTFAQGPEERRLIEQWQAREEMRRQVALRQAEEARDKRQRGQADVRAREEMLRLQMQRQAEELKERMRRAQAAQAGQPREQQGDHPERKIDTLRQAAEFLERAGKHDAARQAREEAELIEHELLRRHREPDPGTEAVLREIRELREQMDHLQKDIRGLHERFRELTERLDSKPGGKSGRHKTFVSVQVEARGADRTTRGARPGPSRATSTQNQSRG